MLVHNTFVAAMPQVNGKWRFLGPWSSKTPEPIQLKFGTIDDIQEGTPMPKLVYAAPKVGRSGENVWLCTFLAAG